MVESGAYLDESEALDLLICRAPSRQSKAPQFIRCGEDDCPSAPQSVRKRSLFLTACPQIECRSNVVDRDPGRNGLLP